MITFLKFQNIAYTPTIHSAKITNKDMVLVTFYGGKKKKREWKNFEIKMLHSEVNLPIYIVQDQDGQNINIEKGKF